MEPTETNTRQTGSLRLLLLPIGISALLIGVLLISS